MIIDCCKHGCQALIDARDQDMALYYELEKAGILFDGYNPAMRALHEKNAQLLETFLAKYGWPAPSKYGAEIHEAAWMIAIHAISKPNLLRRVMQLLKHELEAGKPVAEQYAKLFDRIALYEGRQQIYGTQFYPSPTGWYAHNLFEPEHVDERRATLGLCSFLQGKKECGADEGGFIDAAAVEKYEADFAAFIKEVGWQ